MTPATEVAAPAPASAPPEDGQGGGRFSLGRLTSVAPANYIVYVTFVLIFVIFAITLGDRGFLNEFNLVNILRQAAPIAIMSVALVFVLTAGEIDLSVGSVVGLSALVTAVLVRDHGVVAGVLGGLGSGIAIGLFNGFVVTKIRIPSFLVTLAMLEFVAGLGRTVTDLAPVGVTNQTYSDIFGGGHLLGMSTLLLWAGLIGLVGAIVYYNTRFGAHVRATGDNRTAAATSGIKTNRVRIAVLVMSSSAAAFAGMLYAGRLEAARYTFGETDLLPVIAAAIIGGTSLFGGRGSIPGALVGALLLAMLNNGLILFGLSVAEQRMALGLILLAAVALSLRERKES
jgi:ribose transport system permease protein